MFFAVSFQLRSEAISIKVDGNFSSQMKDLVLPEFLLRLDNDYYLYSENLRYAKSQVPDTEHYCFFWRAYTFRWDKLFLGGWQKVIKPCLVPELH